MTTGILVGSSLATTIFVEMVKEKSPKYFYQAKNQVEKDLSNQEWLTEEKAERLFDSKVLLPGFVIK